ncbi:MAG TPA: riboflavin synthase [Longimicrobiaceae bacterium]|nr:riboflavin synthase [Longimicrobiaceae bacterium]
MFTGIIEEVGTIAAVRPLGNGRAFRVAAALVLDGLALGDSVAVDGVCLTVTALDESGFEVESIATTLERTTLGALHEGRRVNLERAMSVGARLGGHLVLGHVDGVGEVLRVEPREELTLIDFTLPGEVERVTVLHGSVTLNGISLTVNALPAPGVAQVSIIPFTREHTAISELRAGDGVNLEGDVIGKYVRHLLGSPASADLRRAWGY